MHRPSWHNILNRSNVFHMHQVHCAFAEQLAYSFKQLSKPTMRSLLIFDQPTIILYIPWKHYLISKFAFIFPVSRIFFYINTNIHFKRHCSYLRRHFFTYSEWENPVVTTILLKKNPYLS